MAFPIWAGPDPTTNFDRQAKSPFISTEMDNGDTVDRVRFRVYPIIMSVEFVFDRQQYDDFMTFCHVELSNYSGWFMLMTDGPGGIKHRRVKWVGPPAEAKDGYEWRVTGQVRTLSNF